MEDVEILTYIGDCLILYIKYCYDFNSVIMKPDLLLGSLARAIDWGAPGLLEVARKLPVEGEMIILYF